MRLNSFQVAYVTRDIERGIETMRRDHGIEGFIRFDPDIEVKTASGSGRIQVKAATAWDGRTQVELIEPVGGLVDLYLPYLPDDHSLRFHHSAARVPDWALFREQLVREGWTIALESGLDGLEFIYVDMRKTLGHYVEYIWVNPEWAKTLGFPEE
jgi:hypothetical protein